MKHYTRSSPPLNPGGIPQGRGREQAQSEMPHTCAALAASNPMGTLVARHRFWPSVRQAGLGARNCLALGLQGLNRTPHH